jgi:hypothetical protein
MNNQAARRRREQRLKLLEAADTLYEAFQRPHTPSPSPPDPNTFDELAIANELDRIREAFLRIPAPPTHPIYLAIQDATTSLYNRAQHIREMHALRCDMQRAFARKAKSLGNQDTHIGQRRPKATAIRAKAARKQGDFRAIPAQRAANGAAA